MKILITSGRFKGKVVEVRQSLDFDIRVKYGKKMFWLKNPTYEMLPEHRTVISHANKKEFHRLCCNYFEETIKLVDNKVLTESGTGSYAKFFWHHDFKTYKLEYAN